mgnify:CR=1 FL=1
MASPSSTRFDLDTFKRALEEGDSEVLTRLFTEDAEMEMIDRRTPPSMPTVVHGREAIEDLLRQVYEIDMTHEILQCVVQGDHAAYTERCVYPDGNAVMSMTMLDLAEGRIAHQSTVQAWDEEPSPVPASDDFSAPTRVEEFARGRAEFARVGGRDVVRLTLQPGWQWSVHIGPAQGSALCRMRHGGYMISGRLRCRMADGTEQEFCEGEVVSIPPEHDAWVMGDEPVVFLDWQMCD